CKSDPPDIVLMDLVMPNMNGVEATKKIMEESPCPILIVTASLDRNVSLIFTAMGYGALDVALTPCFNREISPEGAKALIEKISTIEQTLSSPRKKRATDSTSPTSTTAGSEQLPLLLIGASTGGPKSIKILLESLEVNFPLPILIIQHLYPLFAGEFAHWLSESLSRKIHLAKQGDSLLPNQIYLLVNSGGFEINSRGVLTETPYRGVNKGSNCTESQLAKEHEGALPYSKNDPFSDFLSDNRHSACNTIDQCFLSAAENWKSGGIGVLLTGAGADGVEGLLALQEQGWLTIVEDPKGCIAPEKPLLATERGAAKQSLPIYEMGKSISQATDLLLGKVTT
ncbi:MAG: response regulator, partial [Chlamydiia bacterium]|nr:response regulator [Chlamydiia bacterium]